MLSTTRRVIGKTSWRQRRKSPRKCERHQTPNVTATVMDDRVRHLRDLAVALTRCKGTSFADGLATVTVYRDGPLTIRYWPKQGLLDVWYGKKVLVIERREGKPHVVHYEPGIWEQELAPQAAQRHKETLAPGNGDSAFAVIFPKGRHVLARRLSPSRRSHRWASSARS